MNKQMLDTQIQSMRLSAFGALEYHYTNYSSAQSGIILNSKEGEVINTKDQIRKSEIVRLELIAYLNWLGRIFHFVENMKNNGYPNLILSDDFKIFRDKWASHRSADYPKKDEPEELHDQILINLDISQRFNSEGQYEPELWQNNESIKFNLLKKHSQYMSELKNIFAELNQNYSK